VNSAIHPLWFDDENFTLVWLVLSFTDKREGVTNIVIQGVIMLEQLMIIMWYTCRYQYLPVCLMMMMMWYTFRYQYLPECLMMIMWYTFRYQYLPVYDDDNVVHIQVSVCV